MAFGEIAPAPAVAVRIDRKAERVVAVVDGAADMVVDPVGVAATEEYWEPRLVLPSEQRQVVGQEPLSGRRSEGQPGIATTPPPPPYTYFEYPLYGYPAGDLARNLFLAELTEALEELSPPCS